MKTMHLTSWIGGFLLGVLFSMICAWIDGFFYRRAHRLEMDQAIDRLGHASSELVKLLEGLHGPPSVIYPPEPRQ